MNDIKTQLHILKTKNFRYPYVVASGKECASSRGSIIVFQTLAAAIACRDALNQNENNYQLRAAWEVKRLDFHYMNHSIVFFEELIEKGNVPTVRDYTRRDNITWRRL